MYKDNKITNFISREKKLNKEHTFSCSTRLETTRHHRSYKDAYPHSLLDLMADKIFSTLQYHIISNRIEI